MSSGRSRIPGVLAVLLVAVGIAALLAQTGDGVDQTSVARPEVADRIEALLRKQDTEAARAEFEQAGDALHPGWGAYLQGLLLLSTGDRAEARTRFEQAFEALPEELRVIDALRASLTDSPADQERETELVAHFLALHPDDERALLAAALHRLRGPSDQRDPEQAWAHIQSIRERREREGRPEGMTQQHEVLLLWVDAEADSQTGRSGSALAKAKQLSKVVPTNPDVWAFCGDVARRAGELNAAMQAYEQAVGLAPEELRYHEYAVQMALEDPNPLPEVQRVLSARTANLLERWPDERSVRVLRARALVRCTDVEPEGYDKARLIYEQLRKDYPRNLEVLRNLGILLYDWKQAGRPGDYLDDAYRVLSEYERYGGTFEGQLLDIWTRLRERRIDGEGK